MTPSEYRYEIESAHYEITKNGFFLLTSDQFQLFADMARHSGSGSLVIDNWKIFLGGNGEKSPESYFEWWNEYRPDKIDMVHPEKKKSPFDDAKRKVGLW